MKKSRKHRQWPADQRRAETAAILDHLHRRGLIRDGAEAVTTPAGRKRSLDLFKRYLRTCLEDEGLESACALVDVYHAGLIVPVETPDGDVKVVLPFADSRPRQAALAELGG